MEIAIIDAIRTPIGKFRGALAETRADHLGAHLLRSLAERNPGVPDIVEDVVFGCVTQVGEQCGNIARTALLSAGWPETIPGMTVDRKCGSSEAALHTAIGEIASGMFDVVVAGGAENMSRVPMGGNRDVHGEPFGWLINERFALTSQGIAAENLADKYGFSRTDCDIFAAQSHARAAAAQDQGWFEREIVPVPLESYREIGGAGEGLFAIDETVRRGSTVEKLGTLKLVFKEGGTVSAGNASQISDGASVLLLASLDAAKRHGLKPRAIIRQMTTVGSDPELMLTGPIHATRKLLFRAGLTTGDIDLFEVNEAFAPVPMAWMRELGVGADRLNVNGGAIALGHPLGASGARIMTSLLHELERRQGRFALQSICCAGGLGTATLIERLV